jgi:pimeloyl-ACP methyl ester carboxylesterase
MLITKNFVCCCSWLLFTAACSSTSTNKTKEPVGGTDAGGNGNVTEVCDKTKRPILFVHGIMGGGDNFELQAQRFMSNGYCKSAIRAYDYDATYLAFGNPPQTVPQSDVDANQIALDAAVDKYRTDTGVDTIDLVGHSFGTATSAIYLSDATHAAKIAHYAQAAGAGLAAPVPEVNLSSDGDFVAGNPKKVAPAPAENPDIGYIDHVGVLTSKESFAAMYQLFNGAPPASTDVVPEQHIEVSGYFKNFSDNTPHAKVTVGVYEVDPATGDRINAKPDFEFVTGDDGSWGPFVAKPQGRYEFLEPGAGEAPAAGQPVRPQHTYRGPFLRSTHLMYLKALPKAGSFANGIIAGHVQYSDTRSGLILQNSHRAMISPADPKSTHGTDSLTVNGSELLTADVAPDALQLIALFAFDNGQVPLTKVTTISSPFFLSAIDISLPTSDTSPVEIVYDKFTMHVHRWKSDTEGSTLILLDN